MKVAFVNMNEKSNCNVNRGAGYIAASVMEAGHELTFFDTHFTAMNKIAEQVITGEYSVLMLSSMSMQFNDTIRLVRKIKAHINIPTILGGIHATIEKDAILRNHEEIDFLCIGEGMATTVKFLEQLETNNFSNVPNLAYRKNRTVISNPCAPPDDLRNLPKFPWRLFPKDIIVHDNGFVFVHAARGCPYNCTYCCNGTMLKIYGKHFLRFRPIDAVIEEAKFLEKTYSPELLFFFDEMILFDPEYAAKLFSAIQTQTGMPYGIMTRPESITPDMVSILSDTGCQYVTMGVECGSESFRRKYLNRTMTNEQIEKAYTLLKQADIFTVAMNIIGFPFNNDAQLTRETIELNKKIKADHTAWSIFYPFPGTVLHDYCIRNNLIDRQKTGKASSIRDDSVLKGVTLADKRRELLNMFNTGTPAFSIRKHTGKEKHKSIHKPARDHRYNIISTLKTHIDTHNIIGAESRELFGKHKSALICNHIHKCAGTTLAEILRKQFTPAYYDAEYLGAWTKLQPLLKNEQAGKLAIAGHASWGIHELLAPGYNVFYITILRNPLDRFMSAYRFARSRYSLVKSPSEFLDGCKPDFMVSWLGNGNLRLAKERLASVYFMFGLVERFDDFLTMLSRNIGTEKPSYIVRNKTLTGNCDIDHETIDLFNKKNSQDIKLFTWAQAEFESRWNSFRKSVSTTAQNIGYSAIIDERKSTAGTSLHIRSLLDQGEYEQAAELAEKQPCKTAPHCVYLGAIYKHIRNKDKAEYYYSQAYELDSESVFSLSDFYRNKNISESIRVLNDTLQEYSHVTSNIPDSYLNRVKQRVLKEIALTESAMGRRQKALNLYEKAFKINPMTWDILLFYANALKLHGNDQAALELIQPALISPQSYGLTLDKLLKDCSNIKSSPTSNLERSGNLAITLIEDHVRQKWASLMSNEQGERLRVAVFGAGAHTSWLEQLVKGLPGPQVMAVLDDVPKENISFWNIPTSNPKNRTISDLDAIILSSDTVTTQMNKRCRKLFGNTIKLVDLYKGLPQGPYPKHDYTAQHKKTTASKTPKTYTSKRISEGKKTCHAIIE